MLTTLTVVKVGGKIVEDTKSLQSLIEEFARLDGAKILVHGGGRTATATAAQLGITTRMVDGRRVTDADMLRVVTMVYGGLVNKQVVAQLQACGLNALGLTGADMDVIRSHKRVNATVDYGFVGDVDRVNGERLSLLLDAGMVPVLAPLTHDGHGQLLNTNADTIAGETAKALAKHYRVTLVYCFEKAGVLRCADDESSVIARLTPAEYADLKRDGVVEGGMIPKLDNCFEALQAGVSRVVITKVGRLADARAGTELLLA